LDSVTEAVARANRLATEIDLVVVFGSFETVAAALRELNPDPGATGLI
jgi:folylpolyglutamate synthase/dihydropteroate synthase